ncbi:hypothetical protein BDZ88DRAFT_431890 [Geranomyces variabilis]|nr:hypothetical protein BDZ88DRAFT_431890 [Geranomyces variabilis]KAJ3142733.1 hypothetical protein HDU90_002604 [Geranomyces variabilis]
MPRPVVATTDAHFFKRRDQALRCMAPGGALLAITHANPHAPRVFIFLDITLTIPAQKLRLPKGEPETEDTYKVRLSLIVLPPDSTEPHPHMLLPRDNLDEFPHLGRFALYMQSVQRSATSQDPDDPQWSLWLSVHSYRSNKNTAMKFLEIAKRLHELDLPTHSDQDAGVPQQVVSAPVQLYSKHERRKEDRKRKLKEIFPKRAEREDREARAAHRKAPPLPHERGMSIESSSTAGGAGGGEPSGGEGEEDEDEDVQEDESLADGDHGAGLAIELPTEQGVVVIPPSQAVSPSMVQAMTNAFQSLPPAMLLAMSNTLLQAARPPKPRPKPKASSASSSPHSLPMATTTTTTASAGAGGASSANATTADTAAANDNIALVVETQSASTQSLPSDTPPPQSPGLSQAPTSLQTPLLATHTSPPQPPNLDPRVTTLLEVIPYISSMTLEQRRWVVKLILNPNPSAAAIATAAPFTTNTTTATTDARSSPAISDAGSVASADASAATAAAMGTFAKSVPPLPPSIPTSSTADLEPNKSPTASEIHDRLIRRIMEFNPDMNALSPQQRTLLGLSLDVLNAKKRGRKPKNPNSPPRKRGRPKAASVWAEGGGGGGESSEGEGKKNKGGSSGGGGAREDFDYLSMYMPTGIAIGGSNALKPKPHVVDAPTEKSPASAPASDEARVDAATEETPAAVALDELPDAAAAEASDHPPAAMESGETLATVESREEAAAAGAASGLNALTALTAPSAAPKRAAPTSSAIEGSLRKRAKRSDSSTKKRRSKYDLPSESPMPREWSSTDATATPATDTNNVGGVQELSPITSVTVPGTHVVTSPPPPHPQLQPQPPRQRGAVEQSIIDSQITSLLNIIPHLSFMPVQQRRWVIDNLVHPTTNPATFPALPPLTTLTMPTVSSQDQLCEPTPHQTHAWIVWRIMQLDPRMERMTLEQRGLLQRSWPMPGYNMGGVGQAPRLVADPGPPGVVGPAYGTHAPHPPPPPPPQYLYRRPGMPMPQTAGPMHPAYSTPPYQPYANMPMPMMYPAVPSPQPHPLHASSHAHVSSGSPATTASHAPTASPSPHVPPQQVTGTTSYTHGKTTSASSSPSLMPHEFRNNTGNTNAGSPAQAAAAAPTFTTTASSASAPPAHVAPM